MAWFRDHQLSSSYQRGGTGILVRDHQTGRVCGSGVDPLGLGRWTWVRFRGSHGNHLRVYSAYRPVPNQRDLGSVWMQQEAFFLTSTPPRTLDPRQAFVEDLLEELSRAHHDGDQLLVAMDANEPELWRPGNLLHSAFSPLGFGDLHLDRHDRGLAPPTHNRGSRPIDCMIGTSTLHGSPSGYLPFGSAPGDHRPLWLDISNAQVFGSPGQATPSFSARKLQCQDPRVVQKYCRSLQSFYHQHNVPSRSFALESRVLTSVGSVRRGEAPSLSPADCVEWEALDRLRVLGIQQAEASCRRLRTGHVPWTPSLGRAMAVHRFWDRFYQRSIGRHIHWSYLRRLAVKAGLEMPSALPLDEILRLREEAWSRYKAEKRRAPQSRRTFLAGLAQARAAAGQESAVSGLQAMLRRETQRKDAALLRSILRPSQRRGLSSIEAPTGDGNWLDGEWTGAWSSSADRHGIETGCLTENSRRFTQATGTDLLTRPMVDILGPTGCSSTARYILNSGNASDVRDYVSPEAALYLEAHRRPSVLVDSHGFDLDFRTPAYARSWLRMDEYTSSGPSGLHFGHFKANASDPVLAPVDAALAHIPALTGYVPRRWTAGLNVMLEKKPGVFKVTKLRTILLYEADFNHNNKMMGRSMMRYAESNQLLAPEQYGSRKGHSAIYQCLNKVLTFDILRQSRKPAALCSNDAKSCYDRIVHSAAGLAMQRCGVPVPLVESSLRPIQQLKHYIRTAFGDSTTFFRADSGDLPSHGIGQGNGAGPAIWAVVSTPIFNSMRQRGYGIFIRAPYSGSDFFFVGYAFVDDTDLVVNDPSATASVSSVIDKLQTSINFWEASLRASGGALVPGKCHWYLVDYSWTGRGWELLTPSSAPGEISVRSPSGRQVQIERMHPHEAQKTLGVWTAPDGSMTAQLQYLRKKVKEWVDKIRVRHLPHHLVWLSLRTGIMKTLEYPLAATTFTALECHELCSPLLQVGLSRSHIVRSMPRDVVFGPQEVGGFALPNLHVEQGLAHLTAYLQYGRSFSSITGYLLRASAEYLWLELGTSVFPLLLPFHPWSICAVPTWLRCLWDFCSEYKVQVPVIGAPLPLLRSGDRLLMDAFWSSGIRHPSSLAKLNQCRLFLRAASLADITTTDGRYILQAAWEGSSPCGRRPWSDTWPTAPPRSSLDWSFWKTSLITTFGVEPRFRRFTSTLGSWFFAPTRASLHLYCPLQERLYSPVDGDVWSVSIKVPSRRGRPKFRPTEMSLSFGSLAVQPPLFAADVISSGPFCSLGCVDYLPLILSLPFPLGPRVLPPLDVDPFLQPISQVWFDPPHSSSMEELGSALSANGVYAVSDGSSRTGVSGTAAWGIAFDPTTISNLAAGFRVPGPAPAQCSFRSELAGLFAIARVLRRAVLHSPGLAGTVFFGTDSQAVLDHIFHHPRSASLRDHSWDLVSLTLATLESLPSIKWRLRHIRGHQDASSTELDIWARRNIAADTRAALVYDSVPADDHPIFPPSPLEAIQLGTVRVVHNLASALRKHVLAPPLLSFWARLGRFGNGDSSDVAWSAYSQALSSVPQNRRHWVIKATANRSAVGVEMVRRRVWRTPGCPRCHLAVETATHVFQCPHPEVQDKWATSLANLQQWLSQRHTHPAIAQAILDGLRMWTANKPPPVGPTTVPRLAQAHWDGTLRSLVSGPPLGRRHSRSITSSSAVATPVNGGCRF